MARVRQKVRDDGVAATPESSNRLVAIVGVVVVVAVLLGVMIWIGRGGAASTVDSEVLEAAGGDTAGMIIGDENAPLLIKDFSDFSCPHCRDAAASLTPEIIENYVATGQARLQFVPVSVLGEQSSFAAQAAMCADRMGAFWPYHDRLFDRQGRDSFSIENLTNYAGEVGLDRQEFRGCLSSGEFMAQLNENNNEFRRSGGTGTPTFLVGDQVISGAVPFEQMQAVIDEQLAQAPQQ